MKSAILTIGGLVRTTKAVVEEKVLEGRNAGPRLVAWMVHHAAQVICTCMVGADGLTPFSRLTGRKFGTPLAGFGERVWLRDAILERANKFNPRCTEARLLGFCLKSSRCIVVDFDGRFRMVRTIKKEPTPTTDGKLRRKWILSRPPIRSQRQLNSRAQEELGERSILLRSVWRGIQLTLSRRTQNMNQSRGGMGRRIAARFAEH